MSETPPFTVLSTLKDVANNVDCAKFEKVSQPETKLSVEVDENRLIWRNDENQLTIKKDCVNGISLVPLVNNGEDFAALVLSFVANDGESIQYRLVTSHISECQWLIGIAEEVADQLQLKLANELL
ncbi:hypothetical protein [Roseimaritima sediminicola]|uniref:hypothetical protein n=1 Tax=Roseimaritima sediminicola TaxID=2662066 RepID=UPI0012982A75|nr:hypothetical protein [Roseimaritima sediminicola]